MNVKILGALLLLASLDASALTYFLEKDLGVKGNMHYCRYNNGKVYAVNAYDMCELSIEVDGYSPPANSTSSYRSTGFFKGEYQDGFTKVCVYDVTGTRKAIRLNSTELCPLSASFD
ncbi:hypothetical protein IGB42_01605 [Andreprevotia sp. IGB-42]|uniref:hypothetical protein n=1 Tax=Andreprevotia sp. IGB-42 TaxID=2497473 RepID=UPI001359F286|nr:hypothetical protein [Andreprevotia sp. IGB-42]KAF0813926.1 hypothetical protein IGB42_01605 [Andreprevotia sp. IGB-42]